MKRSLSLVLIMTSSLWSLQTACGDGDTANEGAAVVDTAFPESDTGSPLTDVATGDTSVGPVVDESCLVETPDQSLCTGVTCQGSEICIGGACVPQPQAGDLVITEILYDPPSHDLGQEWFEVKNIAGHDVTLRGMTVSNEDGSESFTVAALTLVPAGCHAVIAQDGATAAGGATSHWKGEEGFYLNNTRDQILLMVDGVEIDRVSYDEELEWPSANGVSLSLDPSFESGDNSLPTAWCFGVDAFEATTPDGSKSWSKGSPGIANASCDFECFKYDCGPRPDECTEAGLLKTYSGPGTCIPESGCDFSAVSETIDCAQTYGMEYVCQLGACVNPCEGQICSTPPAAECQGNSVVTYGANGQCSAGLCEYPVASTVDCGADVCSTAMGPASCVDASLAGVQLSGYRIQLLQNGESPDHVKFEVELSGDFNHGVYIVVTRNATLTTWPAMFSPALAGDAMASIAELYDSEDSWQFNSVDDPVRILDASGQVVDMGYGVKNGVNRRQEDGSWQTTDAGSTSGATGAPASVAGVGGPVYIFEIGEACSECQLTDFNGNYALLYVP